MISSVSHVSLVVPDLKAAVAHNVEVMGLREVEHRDGTTYLTHGSVHHSLELTEGPEAALGHVGLQADGEEGMANVRGALERAGVALETDGGDEPGLGHALRFRTPGGHLVEVHGALTDDQPENETNAVRPERFGHVLLKASDAAATVAFFLDVLGFRVSDVVGPGIVTFMRCNSEHHGIGVAMGPNGMHHYAWQVASAADVLRSCDVLADHEQQLYWGPGRHGTGHNVAAYHFDSAGILAERYAEMALITDEATYEPGSWSLEDHRSANVWGPGLPADFPAQGVGLAAMVSR